MSFSWSLLRHLRRSVNSFAIVQPTGQRVFQHSKSLLSKAKQSHSQDASAATTLPLDLSLAPLRLFGTP